MAGRILLAAFTLCNLGSFAAGAQSPTDMTVLKGLAPVAALSTTQEGRAALGANFVVTGGI
jgi:hypothetical protein